VIAGANKTEPSRQRTGMEHARSPMITVVDVTFEMQDAIEPI